MRYYLGITDHSWYTFLAEKKADEVNFWQPGGSQTFKVLRPGEPFLFKLKSPYNAVAGGGFFVRQTFLPLDIAWNVFGEKNGGADYFAFAEKIYAYRAKNKNFDRNPTIGCIVLTGVFFLPPELWVPQPPSWKANIVTGKSYETATDQDARRYLDEVLARIPAGERLLVEPQGEYMLTPEAEARYREAWVKQRLGQSGFRVEVQEAYQRRCAITGEKTLPALEAAHIRPYAKEGPHRVSNGLLLRADVHKLFDSGYVTVTPDLHIEVSPSIRERFENGREYYAYHGQELAVLPGEQESRPDPAYLRWHNDELYVG